MAGIFTTEDYAGMIPDLKSQRINMDLLFNTRDKNADSRISKFKTLPATKINRGTGAITECGFIPRRCINFGDFEVEAAYPLSVNDVLDDCIEQASENDAIEMLDNVARDWRETEATWAYNEVYDNMTDNTQETLNNVDLVNIRDQITFNLAKLGDAGYRPQDLIVAVSTSAYYELMNLEIGCCDIGVASAETGTVFSNKLGVKRLVWVPTNILSGHFAEDGALLPEDTVKFAIYLQDYAIYKEFCEKEPRLRNREFDDSAETRSQIIGSEYIGAEYYDANSGIVVYEAEETTPATGTLTAGVATATSVPFTYDYSAGTDEVKRSKIIIYETANPEVLCGEISPAIEGVGTAANFTENIKPDTEYTVRLIQSGNDLDSFTVTTPA